MVFGPMLQVYKQQQQLRPYYDFLSVDGVRYTVNGQKRMFASAVRELPSLALVGQKEWLKYWGSSALQFTHGMGLVMSPVNRTTETGDPTYAVKNVPPDANDPRLEHEPRIYIGEGMKDEYILTNARGLRGSQRAGNEPGRHPARLLAQTRRLRVLHARLHGVSVLRIHRHERHPRAHPAHADLPRAVAGSVPVPRHQ
jgi:hypothetical protein